MTSPVVLAQAAAQAEPLLQRLGPAEQIRVLAALAILLTFGGLLLLTVRASGRITRWYMNRPIRQTRMPGDPLAATIEQTPARPAPSQVDDDPAQTETEP